MAGNFFELVKDGFFNPFANSDKRLNYDLLILINSKMSLEKLQASREDIVEWILDYLEGCPVEFHDDENESTMDNPRECANQKLRYFVKCGWLIEDYENVRTLYQLDDNGIKILEAMSDAVKDDSKSMEFSGFVYAIYSHLKNFDANHAVDLVEQIGKTSDDLTKMLRGLNTNIKKYLTKLIRENEAKPSEILNTLLHEYQEKVVLKAFNNFRQKDNPSRYKQTIIEMVEGLSEETKMEELIQNYLEVKCNGDKNDRNIEEAKKFFEDKFYNIVHQFEEIGDYIEMLNNKNARYLSTAKSRLNFLLNEEKDIEGRIIECLKGFATIEDDFFENEYFGIYSIENVDENSLYQPKTRKINIQTANLVDKPIEDIEEVKRLSNKLFHSDEFSTKKINKYIMKILGEKRKIYASEISISSFDELMKIFLAQIYVGNNEIKYKIQYLDESITVFGYKLHDFIIERK